jgi:hypothetical protein
MSARLTPAQVRTLMARHGYAPMVEPPDGQEDLWKLLAHAAATLPRR